MSVPPALSAEETASDSAEGVAEFSDMVMAESSEMPLRHLNEGCIGRAELQKKWQVWSSPRKVDTELRRA